MPDSGPVAYECQIAATAQRSERIVGLRKFRRPFESIGQFGLVPTLEWARNTGKCHRPCPIENYSGSANGLASHPHLHRFELVSLIRMA